MLHAKYLLAFPIALFCIASCSSLPSTKNNISTDVLVGEWAHSHEESTTKENVFRPNSYNLPPSRGRIKMMLKEGGVLLYATNGPNDQPVRYEGTWLLSGNKLVLDYDNKQLKYTVVDISNSILKLK